MKELTNESKLKVLRQAAIIVGMNGSRAGDRCCQDWSGDTSDSPETIFTDDELDSLTYNYELNNSYLEDYEEGRPMMHDEMYASFVIKEALLKIIDEINLQECE